jgi:hypothetical protein
MCEAFLMVFAIGIVGFVVVMNDRTMEIPDRGLRQAVVALVIKVLVENMSLVSTQDHSFSGTIDVADGRVRIKDRTFSKLGEDTGPIRECGRGEGGREAADHTCGQINDAACDIRNTLLCLGDGDVVVVVEKESQSLYGRAVVNFVHDTIRERRMEPGAGSAAAEFIRAEVPDIHTDTYVNELPGDHPASGIEIRIVQKFFGDGQMDGLFGCCTARDRVRAMPRLRPRLFTGRLSVVGDLLAEGKSGRRQGRILKAGIQPPLQLLVGPAEGLQV